MKKIFLALTLCFAMIFSAKVSAEEVDAMQAFREAVLANSDEDNRPFHEDFLFAIPSFQGELEFIGVPDKDAFKAAGNLEFWLTDDSGNLNDVVIPFYLTQVGKDMKIYFQDEKKWYVFQSPSVAAVMTDIIATPTAQETEEFMGDVKEVTILRDSVNQRTMLVKLDGKKIADEMNAEAEKNPADNGVEGETQDKFFDYLDTALRNADIWYMWTLDKHSGKTTTISFHLSNLVQEFARAVLADETQPFGETFKDSLASVAFYSDVKAYTNFLNADAKKKVEIPKNVLKAKPVESLVSGKK